jgi:hypothetical protein
MDYGYPQFTEAKILAEYIKTDAYRMEVGAVGVQKGGPHGVGAAGHGSGAGTNGGLQRPGGGGLPRLVLAGRRAAVPQKLGAH